MDDLSKLNWSIFAKVMMGKFHWYINLLKLSRSGEMVYTPALGAGAFGHGGSSPLSGT